MVDIHLEEHLYYQEQVIVIVQQLLQDLDMVTEVLDFLEQDILDMDLVVLDTGDFDTIMVDIFNWKF